MKAMENLELGDQLGNRPSVQILVVVAITQVDFNAFSRGACSLVGGTRSLRTEVEKGFMSIALIHE